MCRLRSGSASHMSIRVAWFTGGVLATSLLGWAYGVGTGRQAPPRAEPIGEDATFTRVICLLSVCLQPKLTWNSMCSPGSLRTLRDSPSSAFQMLGTHLRKDPSQGVNSLLEGVASHMVSTQFRNDLLFCLWLFKTESPVAQAGFEFCSPE